MLADQTQPRPATGNRREIIDTLGVLALGAAIPLLIAGRGALGAAAVVALLCLLTSVPGRNLAQGINESFKSPLGGAVWLTFGVWLVSVAVSPEIGRSAMIWLRMVALLTAGTALAVVLRQREDLLERTLRALVIASMAGVLLGLVALHLLPEGFAWLRGHFQDAVATEILKSYGTAVACLMPVVLWAGWRAGGVWRVIVLVFQILAVALLFSLQSRSGLVAAGLGLGVVGAWLALRRLGRWGVVAVILVAAGLLVAVFLDNERNNTIDAALGLPTWLVDAHRQAIWNFALSNLGGAPWFGTGFDMITRLPGAQEIVAGSTAEILPSHPHNFAVEVLIETGVIGFTFFAMTLLLLLAGGLRALRHCGAAGAALLGLSAAFWFASLVSYSFWSFWWQATYVLLMALVVAALTPGQVSAGLGLMGSRKR